MNARALQRVDRWVGVPLCAGLSGIRRVGALFRDHRQEPPPRRILLVKLAEQGATVLAYPAFQAAIEQVGRENVYFLTFEQNRAIADLLGVFPPGNVLTISVEGIGPFVASCLAAIRRLRRAGIDAAVDMDFFSRGSALMTALSGARRRAGFHAFFGAGPYRGNLFTHRVIYNPHVHTTEAFLSLVRALDCDPAALPTFREPVFVATEAVPPFEPTAGERDEARRLAGESTRVILLNANTSDLIALRRWPGERYVELARRLLAEDPEVGIVFTGSPDEAPGAEALARAVGSERCRSVAGRTTLRQLLALYTVADVLVTNDSGPAHFATLTPIQVVTLFGPETPRLFAARTPRNTVLWAGLACSPCVSAYNNRVSPCRDNRCMQAITVEQVCAATRAALARRAVVRAG